MYGNAKNWIPLVQEHKSSPGYAIQTNNGIKIVKDVGVGSGSVRRRRRPSVTVIHHYKKKKSPKKSIKKIIHIYHSKTKKKPCKSNQVRNPKTGRCIKKGGKIHKSLKKKGYF